VIPSKGNHNDGSGIPNGEHWGDQRFNQPEPDPVMDDLAISINLLYFAPETCAGVCQYVAGTVSPRFGYLLTSKIDEQCATII
jgi:hypothetical protein